MKELSNKLLLVYGSIFFFTSLIVFTVVFRGFVLLGKATNALNPKHITQFYILISLMIIGYILFLGTVIYYIFKGKEKDLELTHVDEYFGNSLR